MENYAEQITEFLESAEEVTDNKDKSDLVEDCKGE